MMYKAKRGFTLIELLVVVLIIGILAAVALPQYQVAVMKSRFMQALLLAKSLRDAERIYFLGNGAYTKELSELDIDVPSCTLDDTNSTTVKNIYNCDNDIQVRLWNDETKGGFSTSVFILNSDHSRYMFMEEYLSDDFRLCVANFAIGYKVCQGLGGTLHVTKGNGTIHYYRVQ